MTASNPGGERRPRKHRNTNRRDTPTETPNEEAGAPPWSLLLMFGIALGLLVLYGIFGAH